MKIKIKQTAINKIKKMSKEELITIINDICEINDDVVKYLNNTLTNTKLDYNFYIKRISSVLGVNYYNYPKALEIYENVKKTSKDYEGLSEIGLTLLEMLIDDFNSGSFVQKKLDNLIMIAEDVCNDISCVEDNLKYQQKFKLIISDEFVSEFLFDIFYDYFPEFAFDE